MATGRVIAEDELLTRLAAARFVLLGKTHDNPDHHRLQAAIVAALSAAGRTPAVAFEMLDSAQQSALAAHLAGGGGAAGLGSAVGWSGWPGWDAHYRPIAEAALAGAMLLAATNLPARTIRNAAREGMWVLDPLMAERTGLTRPLPPALLRALAAEIATAHCGIEGSMTADELARTQLIRDAALADALARAATADGGVLIAGSCHTRNDRAVPVFLARIEPGARVAALAFLEVEPGAEAPGDYGPRFGGVLPYDFVWFTPRPSRSGSACG